MICSNFLEIHCLINNLLMQYYSRLVLLMKLLNKHLELEVNQEYINKN